MSTTLSRRQFLAHALVTAGAAALPIALPSSTPSRASAASFSDSIYFGNAQSEQAKAFTTTNTTIVTNSLGLAGRRLEVAGALFTFTLGCDPAAQLYLTLKIWGSNGGASVTLATIDGVDLNAELDKPGSNAPFPGRFYYSTITVPLTHTQGKTSVILKVSAVNGTSRGIYAAILHSNPFYEPPAAELVGSAPSPGKPLTPKAGVAPYDNMVNDLNFYVERFCREQLYGPDWDAMVAKGEAPAVLTGALIRGGLGSSVVYDPAWTVQQWKDAIYVWGITTSNNTNMNFLTIFARAFHADWSARKNDPELIDRIVRGLDFYCVAQGSNGGFHDGDTAKVWIGAPNRTPASNILEGFGDMNLGWVFTLVYDQIAPYLDTTIDHDDNSATAPITRRQAYTQMLIANREYCRSHRGNAPNQDLAQMTTVYWINQALKQLAPADAWPDSQVRGYLMEAVGLAPDHYGGTWFSRRGLPLEANGTSGGGYAYEYGPSCVNLIVDLAAATQDAAIMEQARKAVTTMAYFYYLWDDPNGVVTLVNDSDIGWRNSWRGPAIGYGGESIGAAAAVLQAPAAIRMAQLFIANNRTYANPISNGRSHMLDDILDLISRVEHYQVIATMPAAAPLPMEAAHPDFAWADEQAGAVVLKQGNGTERLYAVLNYRHSPGSPRSPQNATANNLALIHLVTPLIERVVFMPMTSTPGYAGLYEVAFGPYSIAMNASLTQTFTVTAPKSQGKYTKDLISGSIYQAGYKLNLPPQTTVVWALDDRVQSAVYLPLVRR
jgi:hypothetical protein